MKKKSYDEMVLFFVSILSLLSLLIILSFLMRTVSIPSRFGGIAMDLPILAIPFQENISKSKGYRLSDSSSMVILTDKKIYFGEVKSFGKDIINIRNKYQYDYLSKNDFKSFIQHFEKWLNQQDKNNKDSSVVLLTAHKNTSMETMIQLLSHLKTSQKINKVTLAGGIY